MIVHSGVDADAFDSFPFSEFLLNDIQGHQDFIEVAFFEQAIKTGNERFALEV